MISQTQLSYSTRLYKYILLQDNTILKFSINISSRIKSGDENAFEELFFEMVDALVNFAAFFLNDRQLAENVVQDVFITLWEKRESIDTAMNLKSYLFTMTRNKALNELRKKGVVYSDEMLMEQIDLNNPTPDELLEGAETEEQIQIVVNSLPDRCKLVYTLNRSEKMTYREIADHLRISINTVENQMVKALKIIRKHLHNYLTSLFI